MHSFTENDFFFVEMKNDQGEYEPLGVMTAQAALEYSWKHDHRAVKLHRVKPYQKV